MSERAVPPADIAPHAFFTEWVPESVRSDPERGRRLGDTQALLLFELHEGEAGEPVHFALRVAEGRVEGRAGDAEAPDLRVRLDHETWRELNAGTLTAPEAFLRRRVKLEGNLALAVKLHVILGG